MRDFFDEHIAPELLDQAWPLEKFIAIAELEEWLGRNGRTDSGGHLMLLMRH